MTNRSAIPMAGTGGPAQMPRAGLVAAAIAAIVLGSIGCGEKGPGSAKTPDELLAQLEADRSKIDERSDTMMKRIEMFNASRQPGERTLQFSEIFTQDLSPEQRDVLNKLVQEEKDFSYKALLQKIIADRDTIRELQENVMRLEQTLPDKFVVAKRGDRHESLAMTYLTEEAHLDTTRAKALLSQVDQTDELLAGNKVWFFYDPERDAFRTYVTQGEAGQTPLAVRRAQKRQLIQERDTARVEVASLSSDLAFRQNSVFYHAASERHLKDQGVLSTVLKRVRDVKGVTYDEALDLRQGTTITLSPETFGLARINHVRVLPAIYQEGRDFTIEKAEDRSSAKVVILDPEIFKGKEVLLAIGG